MDIKITGLDDKLSTPSGKGSLLALHFSLSSRPLPVWADTFDKLWKLHVYMKKRHAVCNGTHIVLIALPSEVQDEHLPELKKVIEETNAIVKAELVKKAQKDAAEKAHLRRQVEQLAELKKSLKFD